MNSAVRQGKNKPGRGETYKMNQWKKEWGYVPIDCGIGGNRVLYDACYVEEIPGHGKCFGEAGVKRFERDVYEDMAPDIVFLMEGVNDCTHGLAFHVPKPSEHWIRDFLATPVEDEPGTTYMYNSTGSTLLGAIVRKKTRLGLQKYLTPRLFDKIGIDAGRLIWSYMPDGMEVGGGYGEGYRTRICSQGYDSQFGKASYLLKPILKAPYYIFEYEPSAWCTIGGVKTDSHCRALTPAGQVIPGLYVAGMDNGSCYCVPYYDNEGSAVGIAFTTGLVAGEHMAEYLKNRK